MDLYITDNCIKCGACSQINGGIFEITNNGAIINNDKIHDKYADCYDAVFYCPVGAIHLNE